MKWKLGSQLAMSFVLGSQLVAAETVAKITVLVYDYAGIRPAELDQAKAQAARIYQQAGVKTEWLDCPTSPKESARFPACKVPPGPTRLAVRVLSQIMAERLRRPADSFGFALLPEGGSFATVANVFAHRAERISKRHRIRRGVILGHIVAHELGHLILGIGGHSGRGIMLVPWRRAQIRRVAQGTLGFTRRQARQLRANVKARMAAAENERPAGDAQPRSKRP